MLYSIFIVYNSDKVYSISCHYYIHIILQEFCASLQYSIFGSISSIGSMIGALFSGKLADFIGRKAVSLWLFFPFDSQVVRV